MLNDTQRMRGFKAAIDHVVWAGAEVLDLGPDTGVLSFFAAARVQTCDAWNAIPNWSPRRGGCCR